VHYFKGVDAREKYDNFYAQVLKVKDIAILTFAELAQSLLVDYIRNVLLQPEAAEWFSTWWTGARGRYCLAHAGYGGSNNNMGVEVDWRDAKGLVPASSTIGAYTGALVKFIADIGTEHETFLKPTDGLFPSTGVMTKRIYDQLQGFAPDTLRYSVLIEFGHAQSERKWEEIVTRIHGSGDDDAPLHLKIKAYHNDIARGDTTAIKLSASEVRKILIPREWYIQSLNPDGKRPYQEVRAEIVRRARMYEDLIFERTTEGQYQFLDALDLYESFYYVRRAPEWGGNFPLGCICKWCCKWTICEHTALVRSVFDPEVQVPDTLVAETPALRKKCSKVRGTAGPRRARLLKEIAKQKKKSVSKIGYIDAPVPPVPDPPAAGRADDGGAAEPPTVADMPGPAPPPSQSEVYITLPMAHSRVLTSSRRPTALPAVISSVFHRPIFCHPTTRYDMTRIQVSNT